ARSREQAEPARPDPEGARAGGRRRAARPGHGLRLRCGRQAGGGRAPHTPAAPRDHAARDAAGRRRPVARLHDALGAHALLDAGVQRTPADDRAAARLGHRPHRRRRRRLPLREGSWLRVPPARQLRPAEHARTGRIRRRGAPARDRARRARRPPRRPAVVRVSVPVRVGPAAVDVRDGAGGGGAGARARGGGGRRPDPPGRGRRGVRGHPGTARLPPAGGAVDQAVQLRPLSRPERAAAERDLDRRLRRHLREHGRRRARRGATGGGGGDAPALRHGLLVAVLAVRLRGAALLPRLRRQPAREARIPHGRRQVAGVRRPLRGLRVAAPGAEAGPGGGAGRGRSDRHLPRPPGRLPRHGELPLLAVEAVHGHAARGWKDGVARARARVAHDRLVAGAARSRHLPPVPHGPRPGREHGAGGAAPGRHPPTARPPSGRARGRAAHARVGGAGRGDAVAAPGRAARAGGGAPLPRPRAPAALGSRPALPAAGQLAGDARGGELGAPGDGGRPRDGHGASALRRRRLVLAAVAGIVVAVGGAAVGYVLYVRERGADVRGSSTQEFVPTETQPLSPAPAPGKTTPATDWPMFALDPRRLHYLASSLRPPFRRRWLFRAGSLVEFPPAIADGRLYVASNAGVLYALAAAT